MPWGGWVAILIVVIIVVVLTVNHFYSKHKRYKKLTLEFGVPQYNHRSLYPAESYWQAYVADRPAAGVFVDDLTWNNLDMDQVFLRVNACQSEAGDIRLYKSLRTLGDGEDALHRRAALCQKLALSSALRLDLQHILSRIGRTNTGTVQMLTLDSGYLDMRYRYLAYILAILPFICFGLIFLHTAVGTLLLVASLLVNFIVSYVLKSAIRSYNAVFPLVTTVMRAKDLAAKLQGVDAERAKSIRKNAAELRAFGLPLFVMSASNLLAEAMLPDLLGLFLLPLLSYYHVVGRLKSKSAAIAALYDEVGEVDVSCSLLSYRTSLDEWVEPVFTKEKKLAATGLCHPLLGDPVPNSIEMGRSILLTGSNASGKSTFIKAVAVNCILAQSIFTCTASGFAMCRGGVVSAMAISDNIFEGDSYFVAEVKALRRMLRILEGEGFFYLFIDEILRGTNTIERIGASGAFLRHVADEDCLCIAATHDIELVSIVEGRCDQYHFSETVRGKQVDFTYKLQAGPVQTRNALLLLESYDFPQDIVDKARQAVARFEESNRWE